MELFHYLNGLMELLIENIYSSSMPSVKLRPVNLYV